MIFAVFLTVSFAVRVLLTLIFLTAATGKLQNLSAFGGVLRNYRLLPEWSVSVVQFALPILELGIALGLLIAPEVSAPVAAVLLVIFAAAMAVNIRRGRKLIDCGCHQATLRQTLNWALVSRNLVLASAAVVASAYTPQDLVAVLMGVAAGACSYAMYLAMNLLWAMGRVTRGRRIRILGASP